MVGPKLLLQPHGSCFFFFLRLVVWWHLYLSLLCGPKVRSKSKTTLFVVLSILKLALMNQILTASCPDWRIQVKTGWLFCSLIGHKSQAVMQNWCNFLMHTANITAILSCISQWKLVERHSKMFNAMMSRWKYFFWKKKKWEKELQRKNVSVNHSLQSICWPLCSILFSVGVLVVRQAGLFAAVPPMATRTIGPKPVARFCIILPLQHCSIY